MSVRFATSTPVVCTANDDVVILNFNAVKVLFLPSATLLPPGQEICIINEGTGGVTVTPSNSQTIDGTVSTTMTSGTSHLVLVTDGSNWFTKSV